MNNEDRRWAESMWAITKAHISGKWPRIWIRSVSTKSYEELLGQIQIDLICNCLLTNINHKYEYVNVPKCSDCKIRLDMNVSHKTDCKYTLKYQTHSYVHRLALTYVPDEFDRPDFMNPWPILEWNCHKYWKQIYDDYMTYLQLVKRRYKTQQPMDVRSYSGSFRTDSNRSWRVDHSSRTPMTLKSLNDFLAHMQSHEKEDMMIFRASMLRLERINKVIVVQCRSSKDGQCKCSMCMD